MMDSQNLRPRAGFPLFNLGFRPFFLLAALFAVATMGQWALYYHGLPVVDVAAITPFQWHAHEMLFGYTLAVIAGFLLTSVQNWTGLNTPSGFPLGFLVLLWAMSRIGFSLGGGMIEFAVLANLVFMIGLVWSIASRIFRVKQWRQAGILLVLAGLTLAELGVLAGLVERDQWIVSKAIYAAFYLIVLLILIVGRRVAPFFIQRGVGYPCELKQSLLLDILVIVGFAGYLAGELLALPASASAAAAAVVAVAQGMRLVNWHTPGIWRRPLLWSLYLSQAIINVGFLAAAAAPWWPVSDFLVIHTFAVGGIGFVTLSMMSRVSLGHTGRDVHNPPGIVGVSLGFMVSAFVARVLLPLLMPAQHSIWIGLSQLLWIVAFGLFLIQYLPILVAPRADGRPD